MLLSAPVITLSTTTHQNKNAGSEQEERHTDSSRKIQQHTRVEPVWLTVGENTTEQPSKRTRKKETESTHAGEKCSNVSRDTIHRDGKEERQSATRNSQPLYLCLCLLSFTSSVILCVSCYPSRCVGLLCSDHLVCVCVCVCVLSVSFFSSLSFFSYTLISAKPICIVSHPCP